MRLLLEPVHEPIDWYAGSTTLEVISTQFGLRIVVASTEEFDSYVEFRFGNAHAFQVLHERDMMSYWEEPLPAKHMLFRVLGGGWLERATSDYFQVTNSFSSNEWLIVSDTGPCVTVISDKEPNVWSTSREV
jgi:hypothetical protein